MILAEVKVDCAPTTSGDVIFKSAVYHLHPVAMVICDAAPASRRSTFPTLILTKNTGEEMYVITMITKDTASVVSALIAAK